MYSTCLFCNKSLGSNETFETFPVGKRLAFDVARGRLWVVCPQCERWNLSPLEERWEALEEAERRYRDSRQRVATDNIGLAKLREGTTLVRIGKPMRPEFAAWRYGDQFGRRRRRQVMIAGAGVAVIGGVFVGGAVVGASVASFAWIFGQALTGLVRGDPEQIIAKIPGADGKMMSVRRRHLAETMLSSSSDGQVALDLRFKNGQARFEGPEAARIASMLIPTVNRFGGDARAVAGAVNEIERDGSAEAYLKRLTSIAHVYTTPRVPRPGWYARINARRGFVPRMPANALSQGHGKGLFGLPTEHRLALEMALHEEAERRALDGQLAELERAWKEAEEVAAISDNLFLPRGVDDALAALRASEPADH